MLSCNFWWQKWRQSFLYRLHNMCGIVGDIKLSFFQGLPIKSVGSLFYLDDLSCESDEYSFFTNWFAAVVAYLFCSRQLVYSIRLQVLFVDVQFWWQIWRQSFLFRHSIMWGMTNSFSRASPQNFHFSQDDLRPLWPILLLIAFNFY